jgi:hypothetical protein
LAAIRALDQKVGLSWKCGTEVAHQTREVAGRAPASSQRISMAGIVHPPAPDEDEEHPGGVIMRSMPGRAGSDAKARRRRASRQRRSRVRRSVPLAHRFGVDGWPSEVYMAPHP